MSLCNAVNESTGEACDAPTGHSFPLVHETGGRAWTQRDPSAPDSLCPVCGAMPGERCTVKVTHRYQILTMRVAFPHRGRKPDPLHSP